jgi:hypothetical protein
LPVYVNDKFVKPAHVNNTIKGALVELHFELHHFAIQKKAQDSFNTTIEQIIVLCPGEARPATAYKRKNPHDGLIHVKATVFLQKRTGEGSGNTEEHTAADKENEEVSVSKRRRSERKAKESEDKVGVSMSEKRRGKQKAKDLEDEVEEDVEKKFD